MKRRLGVALLLVLGVTTVVLITRPWSVDDLVSDFSLFDRVPAGVVVTADTLNPPPPMTDKLVGGVFALGPAQAEPIQDFVWADPHINGVFLRLRWKDLQTGPSEFDFSLLDREMNQAITHGKYVTLSLGAGKEGTPEWLFSQAGVQGYQFQDGASKLEFGKCGSRLTLADPTDERYQELYYGALEKLAEHLKTNQAWYDSLAYIKVSGANLYTHENRLPNRCQEGCICNGQVWSEAGYTPSGLQNFYTQEMAVIQQAFPGKPMMYALIQDGFPWMNDQGDYEQSDGSSSGSGELIRSIPQVEQILKGGAETWGSLFTTQHNGLQPEHEPNPWVVDMGERGYPTAFQTTNLQITNTPELLQQTFENLWANSDAHYLEVYSEVLRRVQEADGVLSSPDSEANTLAEWNELLQSRAPTI